MIQLFYMHELTNGHFLLLAGYCVFILLASLAGGWIPMLIRLTHTRMQTATSFVSGLMLGIAILHLLPHAWFQIKSIDKVAQWMVAGFVVMFLAQRFLHFHHHDVSEEDPESCCKQHDGKSTQSAQHSCCGSNHVHASHEHTLAGKSASQLSWGSAAAGLSIHTLINGIALAASVAAEAASDSTSMLLGFGTFLAIVLHKPFDAMAISTLMAVEGRSRRTRHLVNSLFSLVIPAGVLLFFLGANSFMEHYAVFLGSALAFAAGTFLCLAASDLLPELQFHSHDRLKLTIALLVGLGLSILVGKVETCGHDHNEESVPSAAHDHPAQEKH